MIKPAIVVIAYNRVEALERLLNSLNQASYEEHGFSDVPLIISIDKSDVQEVADKADEFVWNHGEKKVVKRPERMGLKNHVLSCGDFVNDYDHIIVLEDDLFVAKDFYLYAVKALEFSENDERIAGVSLYSHALNVHVREPFEAIDDGFDNYYMQFAQSWGQAYSKAQWNGFINWLKDNDEKSVAANNVPMNVSSWSDKSWLKYYIKYIIDTDKYFIYPRKSFTTNFGDEGTHADSSASDLQVHLSGKVRNDFLFSSLDNSESLYDAFFENIRIADDNTVVDLYGYKSFNEGEKLLTSKSLPYKIVKSFGRMLRPVDSNIINDISGNDFFLYDTSVKATEPSTNEAKRILYNYRALNVKKMMSVIKFRLFKK